MHAMDQAGGRRRGPKRPDLDLRASTRGAVSTEYVVLLAMAGMVVATAVFGLGTPLVASFSFTRALIVSPTP